MNRLVTEASCLPTTFVLVGCPLTFTWDDLVVFIITTVTVLLLGHSLGNHRKLVHDSYQCPKWRHGRPMWIDAWWQLSCELSLSHPPQIRIEERIANDRFYRFLERTWMAQQVPPALLLYLLGGWGFVWWGVCARITAGVFRHMRLLYSGNPDGPYHAMMRSFVLLTGEDPLGMRTQNVDQRRSPRDRPLGQGGRYFRTVRGETSISSFRRNSFAMRS